MREDKSKKTISPVSVPERGRREEWRERMSEEQGKRVKKEMRLLPMQVCSDGWTKRL